jgi:hypothetical protein
MEIIVSTWHKLNPAQKIGAIMVVVGLACLAIGTFGKLGMLL